MPQFGLKSRVLWLLCLPVFLVLAAQANAQTATVVISQVYGGGGGTSAPTNYLYSQDYVEIFNGTLAAVDISGWSLQYMSAGGSSTTATNVVAIPGAIGSSTTVLAAGQRYLVAGPTGSSATAPYAGAALPVAPDITAAYGSFSLAGGGGKVFLVNNSTALANSCAGSSIVDYIGVNTASCFEGTAGAPTVTAVAAEVRINNGCTDTNQNSTDFTVNSSAIPRNSTSAATPCGVVAVPSNPSLASPTATPAFVNTGSATLLTVTATPGTVPASTGLAVTVDTSALGGSMTQPLYDDGTHGDVTAGDGVYSFSLTIPGSQALTSYPITFKASDSQLRSATPVSTSLTVTSTSVPYTSITLTSSASTAVAGSTVTFTAVATGNQTTAPTGALTIKDGTTTLGAATATASGSVTTYVFNTTALTVGAHTITASLAAGGAYPVNTVTTPASVSVTITAAPVADFKFTVSNVQVIENSTSPVTTLTATVAMVNGFSQPVSFTCAGLPAGSRCTFAPATLTASGTSVLTVAIDGASLHNRPMPFGGSRTMLAFGLLGLPLLFRRKLRTRLVGTIFGALFLGALLVTAGGCSSSPSTGTGASTVTVTATGGSITHTASFTLTVQ